MWWYVFRPLNSALSHVWVRITVERSTSPHQAGSAHCFIPCFWVPQQWRIHWSWEEKSWSLNAKASMFWLRFCILVEWPWRTLWSLSQLVVCKHMLTKIEWVWVIRANTNKYNKNAFTVVFLSMPSSNTDLVPFFCHVPLPTWLLSPPSMLSSPSLSSSPSLPPGTPTGAGVLTEVAANLWSTHLNGSKKR